MSRRISYDDFCQIPETLVPHELIAGELRTPGVPTVWHQTILGNLFYFVGQHVRDCRLGLVVTLPVDVVLDKARPLVVQPDLLYISQERAHIAQDKVYGAPDLVAEVLWGGGALFDRTEKAAFYARYGVREYWLVDPEAQTVEVRRLEPHGYETVGVFRRGDTLRSILLPDLRLPVNEIFAA